MGSVIPTIQMTMRWCKNLDDWNGIVGSIVPMIEPMSSKRSKSLTVTVVTRFVVITAYFNSAVVSCQNHFWAHQAASTQTP